MLHDPIHAEEGEIANEHIDRVFKAFWKYQQRHDLDPVEFAHAIMIGMASYVMFFCEDAAQTAETLEQDIRTLSDVVQDPVAFKFGMH